MSFDIDIYKGVKNEFKGFIFSIQKNNKNKDNELTMTFKNDYQPTCTIGQ